MWWLEEFLATMFLGVCRLYLNRNLNLNSNDENLANSNANGRIAFMYKWSGIMVKTYNKLYGEICSLGNLIIAWREARKGKTRKYDVIEFEKNIERNLLELHYELFEKRYIPKKLETFVLRDPKTRIISKSDFRDRIVHHAIVNVIESIFENRFIYDSCANQKGKGTLFALKRFDLFSRRISKNFSSCGFCLKADVRHYFQEIDLNILVKIIEKRVKDNDVIWLIRQVLENGGKRDGGAGWKGMPLGNLTSQFFANVYS